MMSDHSEMRPRVGPLYYPPHPEGEWKVWVCALGMGALGIVLLPWLAVAARYLATWAAAYGRYYDWVVR